MVLVTGATGHLGNVLIRNLMERGEKVRAIVHPKDDISSIHSLSVEVYRSDINDDFSKALKNVECIFHLASFISITPGHKKLIYKTNVEGTKNVIKIAKDFSIPLIYVSSVHAFSEVKNGSVVDETVPIDESKVTGDYAKSKAIATKEVIKAFKEGLDGFIIFPTGIFGPYDFKISPFSRVLLKYRYQKLKLAVDGKFDFVDVRDVAKSMILLYHLFKEKSRAVNHELFISSGHDIYFENLPLMCGCRKYKILKKPVAKLTSYICLALNKIFALPVEFLPYAIHTISLNYKYSHSKLSSVIKYTPRESKKTLIDFFKWYDSYNLHGSRKS